MIERRYVDALIVGGGPAGLAAATGLWYSGIRDILIVEREKHLGGILRQCIHDGFGLTQLGVTLSGPEYAQRYIDDVERMEIPYITNATVLSVTPSRVVTVVSRDGLVEYEAKAVILTMGCRERTRGALAIPGERPTGVFTAGVAQAYINLYNRMPAREVIILGSGDIGMIMARRLTLEGAHVQGVFEVMPYAAGLPRNVEQCLNDYNIPLYLSRTATKIHGSGRVTGVTISEVDAHGKPIPGTEKEYSCDTVILSVGLIPENELSLDAGVELDPHTRGAFVDEHYMTGVEGVFAAGNVLHGGLCVLGGGAPGDVRGCLYQRRLASRLSAGSGVRRECRACHSAEGQRDERLPALAPRQEASARLHDQSHAGWARSVLAQDAQGDPRGDDPARDSGGRAVLVG